jgi:hypothetical protein
MSRETASPQPNSLQDLLERHRVYELKPLARLLAASLPTRKAELIALIAEHVRDLDRLRQLWDSLDEIQQAAVSEALYAGPFDTTRFYAKYGQDPDWGTARYGTYEEPSVLQLFLYHRTVPRDLAPLLKTFVPPPRPARAQTVDAPPDTVQQPFYDYQRQAQVSVDVPVVCAETERAAQHDLRAVLRLIDRGTIRASAKTRRVTAASARAIAENLYGGDFYPVDENLGRWGKEVIGPIKAFAWPLILQSAGLARLNGNRLQLTRAGKSALAGPPHESIRRAWERWCSTKLLDELRRIETIKGQTGRGRRGLTPPPSRRAAVAAALRDCPVQAWIAVDEFWRYTRAAGHTFEVTSDPWYLYIGDARYGSLDGAGPSAWRILQGRYMLAFLFEYAATLGTIDVAYIPPAGARDDFQALWGTDVVDCMSRYDGLLAFRINNLGAWCLGQVDRYVPTPFEERALLKVLPNMDVVATEHLPPDDVLFLELFSEATSEFVWAIRREKVLSALEEGHSAEELTSFLQAKSGDLVPDNVVLFLAEQDERVSRLVDRGPAVLIEVQDAVLAQLIANDPRMRSLCLLAGQRHLVVPKDAERAFRRALRQMGYGVSTRQK